MQTSDIMTNLPVFMVAWTWPIFMSSPSSPHGWFCKPSTKLCLQQHFNAAYLIPVKRSWIYTLNNNIHCTMLDQIKAQLGQFPPHISEASGPSVDATLPSAHTSIRTALFSPGQQRGVQCRFPISYLNREVPQEVALLHCSRKHTYKVFKCLEKQTDLPQQRCL